MAVTVRTDIYEGSEFRESPLSDDDVDIVSCKVYGLDDVNTAISTASTEAINAVGNASPRDSTLPIDEARSRITKGGPNGDVEARVRLIYRRDNGGRASSNTFSTVANIDVQYQLVEWWAETFPKPDTAGTPSAVNKQFEEDQDDNRAVPMQVAVPIMSIEVPVVLSSSAISQIFSEVGKINSNNFTISNYTFTPNTLRNDGLTQRSIIVQDNSTTTDIEHRTSYQYTARRDGWYKSKPVLDAGVVKADKELIYETTAFSVPPTS